TRPPLRLRHTRPRLVRKPRNPRPNPLRPTPRTPRNRPLRRGQHHAAPRPLPPPPPRYRKPPPRPQHPQLHRQRSPCHEIPPQPLRPLRPPRLPLLLVRTLELLRIPPRPLAHLGPPYHRPVLHRQQALTHPMSNPGGMGKPLRACPWRTLHDPRSHATPLQAAARRQNQGPRRQPGSHATAPHPPIPEFPSP